MAYGDDDDVDGAGAPPGLGAARAGSVPGPGPLGGGYPSQPPFRMTSPFGQRNDPTAKGKVVPEFHNGVDYAAPAGTPVRAAATGKVVFAGRNDAGYGNTVILEHARSNGDKYFTVYAHLGEKDLPDLGAELDTGRLIGQVGKHDPEDKTQRSTGSHLHFEALRGDATVNRAGKGALGVDSKQHDLRMDPTAMTWPAPPLSVGWGAPRSGAPYAPADQPGAWAPWARAAADWQPRGLLDPQELARQVRMNGAGPGLLDMCLVGER